jgi:hypothetical protein
MLALIFAVAFAGGDACDKVKSSTDKFSGAPTRSFLAAAAGASSTPATASRCSGTGPSPARSPSRSRPARR